MGKAALAHGRSYLLKLGASVASARVETPLQVIDLNTRRWSEADRLAINDIGACTLQLDRLLAVDEYRHSKATGSFILIDPESYDTIAMGMIGRP
jgi:sulfate adenylyltransferase subunit 1 (EFTu-like GTPase family)